VMHTVVDVHPRASTERMRGDTDLRFCTYTCTELLRVPLCCHFATHYNFPEKKSVPELNDQPTYMCVCVCVHTHTHTHIHTYIYIHTHTHTHTHKYFLFNIILKHNEMSSTKVIAIACLLFSFLFCALFYSTVSMVW
jgi:hypothetical protein